MANQKKSGSLLWGIILIVVGGIFLLDNGFCMTTPSGIKTQSGSDGPGRLEDIAGRHGWEWIAAELWRDYWEVATDGGLLCVLYCDLLTEEWFLERVYA